MGTWLGSFFAFEARTIELTAPAAAGVCVLWSRGRWIYVGASENVRVRLLAILQGENACISTEMPTEFGFEVIEGAEQREARRAQLVLDLVPSCS
ncbi:MAG TPA: hypothetical protein VMD56_09920 [Steroidobacteraceae bacterium]|nr:hypothetical protein [Steroidobacteraceae bacterium]